MERMISPWRCCCCCCCWTREMDGAPPPFVAWVDPCQTHVQASPKTPGSHGECMGSTGCHAHPIPSLVHPRCQHGSTERPPWSLPLNSDMPMEPLHRGVAVLPCSMHSTFPMISMLLHRDDPLGPSSLQMGVSSPNWGDPSAPPRMRPRVRPMDEHLDRTPFRLFLQGFPY